MIEYGHQRGKEKKKMAYNFIECNREQKYLMPPSLKEWLPEGDLSWFVIDAVEEMDLQEFYIRYREDGWGRAAFNPKMMVSLLLYAYSVGERSSRRIESFCERDVGFRIVTANQKPDHSTLSRFRKECEKELEGLFARILKMCAEAKMVKVGKIALDGTKMDANASLSSNRTQKSIEEEVKKILREASEIDEEEDRLYGKTRRGNELPEEMRTRASRLKRLRECKERLERQAREAAGKRQEKIDNRQREELEEGKKKRCRKPKMPEEVLNKESKANATDPESRIMKTRTGYVQGYNAQAVVTEGQIILAAELTQEENDVNQLHSMFNKAKENVNEAGIKDKFRSGLVDAGYFSERNIEKEFPDNLELFSATKKDWKQRKAMREEKSPRGRIPVGLSIRDQMERKLLTKRGKQLYRKRGQMIEAVFGQIKGARGIDRFFRRGINACASEWKWKLICATHNLLKLFRSGKASWA
ncbi:MAG: transposase [Candidatus Brocadiaceae bacterium]|nr:transposase [Candidatus Brocadiaceae bacterium]